MFLVVRRAVILSIFLTISGHSYAQTTGSSNAAIDVEDVVVDSSKIELKKTPVQSISLESQSVATRPTLDSALLGQSNIQVVPTPLKGSNISLNGMSGESVALYWDGDPILGRVDGALDAKAVSLGTVNRIAVYQGLDSLPFGSQNVAGVISLETPWRVERQLQLRSAAGTFGRTLLSGQASNTTRHGFNYIGSISNWRTEAVRTGEKAVDTYSDAAASLNGSMVFGKVDVATVKGKSVDVRVGTNALRQNSRGVFAGEITEGYDQRVHVFGDVRRENSNFHLSYQQARHLFRTDLFNESGFRFGPNIEESIGNWTVLGGSVFDARETQSSRIGTRTERDFTSGTYAGARYAINENWAVGAGTRYDSGPNLVSPRGEVRYMFATGPFEHATTLESGLGFREVTAKEKYLDFSNSAVGYRVTGNPDLQTERSWMSALRHTARARKLTLRAALFQTRTRNAIGFGPGARPGDLTYSNISQTLTHGVQFGTDYRFLGNWELGLNYQFLNGRNLENGSELFLQPRHRAAFTVSHNVVKGFGVLGQAVWTGRQGFFDNNRNRRIDDGDWAGAYWMTSLELGYGFRIPSVAEVFRVFARVDNALDIVRTETLPGEPRSFMLGALVEL